MQEINASIGFDRKLWRQDIRGSLRACRDAGEDRAADRAQDEQAIRDGLAAIAQEIEAGRFPFDAALEDIHMNIEARLTERIGEAGSGCTPRAAATTRWRRISGSGCATRSTG